MVGVSKGELSPAGEWDQGRQPGFFCLTTRELSNSRSSRGYEARRSRFQQHERRHSEPPHVGCYDSRLPYSWLFDHHFARDPPSDPLTLHKPIYSLPLTRMGMQRGQITPKLSVK